MQFSYCTSVLSLNVSHIVAF
ncbi:hypothetical protein FND36_09865 [Lachnospiraceae bacterium KGMB03038]|nr:hypothetical protein FND36_09865 [Lachnospiraceae bacterium KGMB03038]